MTDKKLIIRYGVMAMFDDLSINRYMGAEKCCDNIGDLLGWMIDVSSQPMDSPRVELYSFSDVDPGAVGAISFCPFCGAKIELQKVSV